ncbi:Selenoprotein F/M [Gracilaria domingensis]|nr:Selenoprotein F/M [Gracilaria domingensis]
MTLNVTRGVGRLTSTRQGRLFTIVILAITCCAIFLSQGNGAKSVTILKPSLEVNAGDKQASPVNAEIAASEHLTVQPGADGVKRTAKIVTCPRCRLNRLPSVKKFVYEHAEHFKPALQIDFIMGESPVLHLYEDDKEVSEIDLDDYDWKKIIQKLDSFGIKPTSETSEIQEALAEK